MSAAPEPIGGGPQPIDNAEVSQTAQLARHRLQEEIERVRSGVEEMLETEPEAPEQRPPEQDAPERPAADFGVSAEELRAELAELRLETRDYVKKKVRKTEKRLERSLREEGARTDRLEERIDQVESDRQKAEVRIHETTERLLDGLLEEVRSIADRLERIPSPKQIAEGTSPKPAPRGPSQQVSIGPIGQRPPGR